MSENESGQLTEKQVEELENLNPDTFDLDEFLDRKWNFPAFSATVYLDGEKAGQINELDKDIKQLQKVIEDKQKSSGQSGVGSLGGSYVSTQEEEDRLADLRAEREELAEEFRTSSLKFVFKLSEPSEDVHKRATETTKKKFPQVKDLDKDNEATTYRGKCLMQATIHGIYNHAGARFGGELTVEKLDKLYARLVPSERGKLETNMVLAISGGNVMQRAADAGFPG